MTYEQLRATILGRMIAFAGIEQARIDYQNPQTRFDPPADGLWCRPNIETAQPVVRGLCQPMRRVPGHIVIQCFDRVISTAPTVALVRLADALAAHFEFWRAPGLICREARFVGVGARQTVGSPAGQGFTQANVEIYFITI